jgi:hypothetical protein
LREFENGVLRRIFELREEKARGRGLDSSGSGYGPMAGSCEHGNEHFGSIKDGEFLD